MTVDLTKLMRPHLAGEVQTYDSMDPPEVLAQQYGVPADKVIKLNGNENPYGYSQKVKDAVANSSFQHYPDPLQRRMRDALADYTGLGPEHIILGAGSDEPDSPGVPDVRVPWRQDPGLRPHVRHVQLLR